MTLDNEQIEVKNNEPEHRYEVKVGKAVAILTYRKTGNQITYLHTGVPDELEGHGIGGKLAHTALEDARSKQLKVVPSCPFVAAYIEKHPEYSALL